MQRLSEDKVRLSDYEEVASWYFYRRLDEGKNILEAYFETKRVFKFLSNEFWAHLTGVPIYDFGDVVWIDDDDIRQQAVVVEEMNVDGLLLVVRKDLTMQLINFTRVTPFKKEF